MKTGALLLLAFILASCGISKNTTENNKVSTTISGKLGNSTSDQSNEKRIKYGNGNVIDGDKRLEIKPTSYTDHNIKIQYPEVINLGGTERETKINALIKSEALQILKTFDRDVKDISLDIDYIPKWIGRSFLSIQYVGSGYVNDAAYPTNIYFTTNLDVTDVKKIKLKDVIKIDKNLIDLFKSGKYIQADPNLNVKTESKGEISNFTDEELISYFRDSDEVSDENELNAFSYFTKDSLGVSVGVSHALGDHAEFEINYRDLINNRLENAVWNDVMEMKKN